jgi:hypothetical protein
MRTSNFAHGPDSLFSNGEEKGGRSFLFFYFFKAPLRSGKFRQGGPVDPPCRFVFHQPLMILGRIIWCCGVIDAGFW